MWKLSALFHCFLLPYGAARARFGLARQDSSVCIYIYWLRFVRKPLYRHIYMYMGHTRPIQTLYIYICMPYICLLHSFACEYALCPLHIPFWHVASFRPTSLLPQ